MMTLWKTMTVREGMVMMDLIEKKMNDGTITKVEGVDLCERVVAGDLSVWDSIHEMYEEKE